MLEPGQHRQLRGLAAQRGASIGSLIRESVAEYLAGVSIEDDPMLGLIGLAEDRSPKAHGDVGPEHDAYIALHVSVHATEPADA